MPRSVANFVKAGLMHGQYLFDSQDDVTAVGANRLADFAFMQPENGVL